MAAILRRRGGAEGKREMSSGGFVGTLALPIQLDRNIVRPHLLDAECVSLDTD